MGQTGTKRRRQWPGARGVKDRSGEVRYWYVTPALGGPEIRIAAPYGTRAFELEYLQARGGTAPIRKVPRRAGSLATITLGEAIDRFRRSTLYQGYAPATVERREYHFRTFVPNERDLTRNPDLQSYADSLLADLTQEKLTSLLIAMTKKKHCDHVFTVRVLYRFINGLAVAPGQPKLADPTLNYPFPKKVESKGFRIWKPDHIERFRENWPNGSVERTIFELAYWTCQRGSDIVRMKWSHIVDVIGEDGTSYRAIHVLSQEKTKASVLIPLSDELQETLDAWRTYIDKRADEIIANRNKWTAENGPAYRIRADQRAVNADRKRAAYADNILRSPNRLHSVTKMMLRNIMRAAIRSVDLPTFVIGVHDSYQDVFSTHGLRKGGMSAIAEAGANTLQIMSISGHTSQRNVDWYIKDREKQLAAVSAIQLRQARATKLKAAKQARGGDDAAANVVLIGRNKKGLV